MKIKFWGTRGSIAAPGPHTTKYGGNTSCVEVSDGHRLVVFDAGTGIRLLGEDLLKRNKTRAPMRGHVFITHFHSDHTQGFPFFDPLYVPGNAFMIYGIEGAGKRLENIFMNQMSPEYFPVTLKEMPAELTFTQLTTRPVQVNDWTITPTYVNHPGLAVGYRLDADDVRKVAYITDNEPFRYLLRQQGHLKPIFDDLDRNAIELVKEDMNLVEFLRDTDVLIHDAQYTIEEYRSKISWGHSFYEFAIEVAIQAKVKQLVLFHHDPSRSDEKMDQQYERCQALVEKRGAPLRLHAAYEGLEINI